MAVPIDFDAVWREIEDELLVAGMNLRGLRSSSSIDELIAHLLRVERVLTRVWQKPPMFIKKALLPSMTALIKDELLKHPHENIQFIVASCLNQVTRITAPTQPYPDNKMKDVFRLFTVALRQLSPGAGDNFFRAVQILGAMVRMKTVLIMMDLDIEPMIVEMFQIFSDIIRPNHSVTIFKYMVAVMTMVIEESGEVSLELLRPLLDSVRMDNKNTAYIAWELGRFVIEKCSTKLQPYIREAVKKMNLEVNDYAEIVVSLCQDTSNENMVDEEITTAAALSGDGVSNLDGTSEAERVDPTPQVNDVNGNEIMPDNKNSSEKLGLDTGAANDAEIVQKRRGRKPNSLMKPEEGYEHIWTIGDKKSCKVSRDSDKKAMKTKMPSDSSHGEFDSVDEGNIGERGRSKNKESTINQLNDQHVSSEIRRESLDSELKARGSKRTKQKRERVIAGLSTVEKGEGSHIGTDSVEKDRLRDVADKMVESPVPNTAKAKAPKNLAPEAEEMSNADYGEEMVNVRITVWWPMDKTFYTGTVEAFDPLTKKHKIRYDDDEEEVLDLREEKWELFNENQPRQTQPYQKQEADIPSPVKEIVENEKKITKRKAGSSRKQLNPSSSKISKSEGCSFVHVKDEPDEEDEEMPKFSFKHGKSQAGKKKSKPRRR